MGYTSSAFGILVHEHQDYRHKWLNLIAKKVTLKVNGENITFLHPFTEEINEYRSLNEETKTKVGVQYFTSATIELFDDIEPTDDNDDDFYQYNCFQFKHFPGVEMSAQMLGGCATMIGYEISSGKLNINPENMLSLECLRQRLVDEHRLSSKCKYTLRTNCCS